MDFHEQLHALQERLANVRADLLQQQSRLDDSGGIVENIQSSLHELKQLMEEAKSVNIAEVTAMLESAIELQLSLLRQPTVLPTELSAQIGNGMLDDQFIRAIDIITDLAKRLSDRLSDFEKALEHVKSLGALLSVMERRLERAQENRLAWVIEWVDRKASQITELVDSALPTDVIQMMSELEETQAGGDVYGLFPPSLHIFDKLFDATETEFPDIFERALYKVHGPRWRRMRFRDLPADDQLNYHGDVNRGAASRIRRGMRWIFLLMGVRADGDEWPEGFGDPHRIDVLIESTGFNSPERRLEITDALMRWDVLPTHEKED